jgi:hypothetical protein
MSRFQTVLSYRPASLHRLADRFLGIDSWTPETFTNSVSALQIALQRMYLNFFPNLGDHSYLPRWVPFFEHLHNNGNDRRQSDPHSFDPDPAL